MEMNNERKELRVTNRLICWLTICFTSLSSRRMRHFLTIIASLSGTVSDGHSLSKYKLKADNKYIMKIKDEPQVIFPQPFGSLSEFISYQPKAWIREGWRQKGGQWNKGCEKQTVNSRYEGYGNGVYEPSESVPRDGSLQKLLRWWVSETPSGRFLLLCCVTLLTSSLRISWSSSWLVVWSYSRLTYTPLDHTTVTLRVRPDEALWS